MKMVTWVNIRLMLMMGAIVFLYSFASYRNSVRKIKKTEVVLADKNSFFLTEEMVNKLLIEKTSDLKTVSKVELDLKNVEKSINRHKFVQKAEVFVSVDGVVKAVVKQKKPLGRIFDVTGSFYIDSEGDNIPLSDNFTARVPLISGDVDGVKKEKLSEVLKKIDQDDFLKKNIIGVRVLANGALVMANRNFDYQIDFGRIMNVDRKFKNYKAFFQKAVQDSTLENYRIINLKFTKQVVCLK